MLSKHKIPGGWNTGKPKATIVGKFINKSVSICVHLWQIEIKDFLLKIDKPSRSSFLRGESSLLRLEAAC